MSRTKMAETTNIPTEGTEPDTTERSMWSRTGFVLSVVLVLIIGAAALWLIFDDPDPTTSSPAATAPIEAPVAAGCGPRGGGDQLPPTEPPTTTWQLIGTMAAPSSPDVGPARIIDGVPLCYAPDPVGALFAAANFAAATSDPDLREAVLERFTAPGAGKEAALIDLRNNPGGSSTGVQIAGFAFSSYTARDSATVDLALTYQGSLLHVPLQMTWIDDDWRVVLPVTGDPYIGIQPLAGMSGYVPWQGA